MSSTNSTRSAIVTGSSRGIGACIANRLARDGIGVVVNFSGAEAEAQSVVREIVVSGGHAIAVQADIRDPAAFARLFDAADREFGGTDILVNNAGVIQPGMVPIADTDDDLFARLIDINLKGTFHGLRLAAKRLRMGGRIVNFSTSLVELAIPGTAVYAAAKVGVEQLTNVFAKELRGRDITVNAVAPGPTATSLFLDGKSEELIAQSSKAAPLERLGSPDDIAGIVSFLVGPDGGWVNGQTIRANGGLI